MSRSRSPKLNFGVSGASFTSLGSGRKFQRVTPRGPDASTHGFMKRRRRLADRCLHSGHDPVIDAADKHVELRLHCIGDLGKPITRHWPVTSEYDNAVLPLPSPAGLAVGLALKRPRYAVARRRFAPEAINCLDGSPRSLVLAFQGLG